MTVSIGIAQQKVCDKFSGSLYQKLKKIVMNIFLASSEWRKRTGGIFFDDFNYEGFDKSFSF